MITANIAPPPYVSAGTPTDAATQVMNEALLFWISIHLRSGTSAVDINTRLVTSGLATVTTAHTKLGKVPKICISLAGVAATGNTFSQTLQNWCDTAHDEWFLTEQGRPDLSLT